MSALASLVRAYDRLAERGEAPAFGYSVAKIGFLISLNKDGTTAGPPIDLREGEGKKKTPVPIQAPQPAKRTSGVAPNFLWDKSSYVLGVTAGEGKRTGEEHDAFVARHKELLRGCDDEGLRALLRFLESWCPDDFAYKDWPQDIREQIKDQNIVFSLESERLKHIRIHDRPAARALWARLCSEGRKAQAACLVTGEHGPVARLHPAIKGVWGAQSSGASIVSFNIDAFTSYGHEQGDNAPVSEAAAFAYTTALNHFLERDSGHRVQIGDASTVFWADASDAAAAEEAEDEFAFLMGVSEKEEETRGAKKIGVVLEAVRQGKALADLKPGLLPSVRFYVLGLSPNAARLSVRFYIEDDFGEIASRYLEHVQRMRIDPPPKEDAPSMWRLLIETASQRKSENILPNLAGEWLRAILTGAPYPLTLLSTLLMRLRADHDVNVLRVAMLKVTLIRNFNLEVPVSLDPENADSGYLLGRLFATYEYAQTQALGGKVNATIRDQYYGTASTTPRAVFPLLQRKATHHLSKLRKENAPRAKFLDGKIGEIFELAAPESLFVPTLTAQRQALFAVGYYHQRNDFYRRKDDARGEPASQE